MFNNVTENLIYIGQDGNIFKHRKLTDEELDTITGMIAIINPGRRDKKHKKGGVTCTTM